LGLFALGKGKSGLAMAQPATAGEFVLAGGGRSLCTIVVNHGAFASAAEASAASDAVDWFGADSPSAAVCTESFAATELRHYLCAMTGLDPNEPSHFPIRNDRDEVAGNVIIVGNERSNRQCVPYRAELGMGSPQPQGFRVKTVRKKDGFALLLAGNDRVGTLYAVYDFLNLCGVRWFSPSLKDEIVPRRSDLSIPPIDRSDAPRFSIRGFWAEFYEPQHDHVVLEGKKGTVDFFNWMARNRMNYWNAGERAVPPGEMLKRGLHLNSFAQPIWTLLQPDLPYPYRHSGFPGGADKPADPYPVSPDFRGDVNGDGILSYSEAHPEWYGMGPDGQRHFPTDPYGYDYCTSNPDMVAEFVKNLVEKLQSEFKGADYVDWVPQDQRDRWCECDNCKKLGTPTDRNLLMTHYIRQGLKRAQADGKLNRDVKVNFTIYFAANVLDPPTRPLPEDFDYDAILGTFYPIHRCYVHGLDDPACTEFNHPCIGHLARWRESPYYKGKFIIGEFYNVSGLRDLPILLTRVMAQDIRYYDKCGVHAMHYMHVPMANWGPRAVTNSQYSHMLWNPAVNVPDFLDDYFRLRYETAHVHMRAWYASLEQTMLNVPEYVTTPAHYNLPPGADPNSGDLARELRLFADGKTTNIFPFRHLRLAGEYPPPDDGPSMEASVHELERCERLMDQALALTVTERVRACILEDEGLFRYAAATLRLYYFMARSTQHPLRSPEWVREMRGAALQAEYLDSHPVGFAAAYGGTLGMMRNALEATGIRDVYLKWKALMP
jgi:hypothetical protein